MGRIRWGILGPGKISGNFVNCLPAVDGAIPLAVASNTSLDRAQAFASKYSIPRVYSSYDELLSDSDVDAVYIGTTHNLHCEPSVAGLRAGKAVLCEKPMTVNLREAALVIETARETGVFFMEALWTRFFPIMSVIRSWIDSGRIGEPRMLHAHFGFRAAWDPEGRLLNPALAGGSILDVGIYPVSFSQWVFGVYPREIQTVAHIGQSGVDEQTGILLSYPGGAIGALTCAVRTETVNECVIFGTEGRILVHAPFWRSEAATFISNHHEETIRIPREINGYEYETREVARCLDAGLRESPDMTWENSLDLMKILDSIRAQAGLRYPFEA